MVKKLLNYPHHGFCRPFVTPQENFCTLSLPKLHAKNQKKLVSGLQDVRKRTDGQIDRTTDKGDCIGPTRSSKLEKTNIRSLRYLRIPKGSV